MPSGRGVAGATPSSTGLEHGSAAILRPAISGLPLLVTLAMKPSNLLVGSPNSMNLRQLHYFCEKTVGGSAAQPVKKLFLAPIAVSMSLSYLESELGGQLFEPATRPMPLTALGQFLLPRTQELLGQAERLAGDAKRVALSRQGRLGTGFTRSVMLYEFPAAERRFSAQYPDVRLEIVELLAEHQPAQITSGEVHVGISRFVEPMASSAELTA